MKDFAELSKTKRAMPVLSIDAREKSLGNQLADQMKPVSNGSIVALSPRFVASAIEQRL